MTAHVLDRPIWSALTTRQSDLAIGSDLARRYPPDIGLFAACRDDDPESLQALTALIAEGEIIYMLQVDEIAAPPGAVIADAAQGVQMIAHEPIPLTQTGERIVRLGGADAPDMLALATLTKPGPFFIRTPMLGEYWGVRDKGKLVAMAGERMKHEGFTEVSGVCTHPGFRGRGLARALSAKIANRIAERGEAAYLHAYATNTAAIGLYESLGFKLRCAVNVAAIERG